MKKRRAGSATSGKERGARGGSQANLKKGEISPQLIMDVAAAKRKTLYYLFLLLVHLFFFFYKFLFQDYNFFQLTHITQILLILVATSFFVKSLAPRKGSAPLLQEVYTTSLGLASVVAVGYWSLRLYDPRLIINGQPSMDRLSQLASTFTHGGNIPFLLCYGLIERVGEYPLRAKVKNHLACFALFAVVQACYFAVKGSHIYPFIRDFSWPLLCAFEGSLAAVSIAGDFLLTRMMVREEDREGDQDVIKFVELKSI